MINKVISVCTKRDLNVFATTAKRVSKHIQAQTYVVVVPAADLSAFQAIDLGHYTAISEEKYAHIGDKLRAKLGPNNKRFGWYFQQFIKLSELDDGGDTALNLIWDADTMPLKNIDFERDGKVYFYQGREHHTPYFALIEQLLDTPKLSPTSFIAQCFPCRAGWMRGFQATVKARFDSKNWVDTLIDMIDPAQSAGFSEYETLGTYILKTYPNEITLGSSRWLRHGQSVLGTPDHIDKNINWLLPKYDYVAFEYWDAPTRSFKTKLRYLKSRYF